MILLFLLCLSCLCGFLLLLIRPTKKDIRRLLNSKKPTFQNYKKKRGKLQNSLEEIKREISAVGRKHGIYGYCGFALFLLLIGIFLSVGTGNLFLLPTAVLLSVFLPFFLLKLEYFRYRRILAEELESALNSVTVSYERSENFLTAVKENLPDMQEPVRTVFAELARDVETKNPNLEEAVRRMKEKIPHAVFWEWCDSVVLCLRDRSFIRTLKPILKKLTEIKVIMGELGNILYSSLRTYWVMLILSIALLGIVTLAFPALLHISLPQWLIHFLFAFNLTIVGFTTGYVLLQTQDIPVDI